MIPLVSPTEYIEMDRPHMDWLVKGLIPRPGFIFLTGEPKSGKSFLALQLALCIVQGESFLGHSVGYPYNNKDNIPVSPSHTNPAVLYLQLDTSELVWRDRLAGLRDQGVDLLGSLLMPHPDSIPGRLNVLEKGTRDWLQAVITAANPALVIVDVLRQIHNADEDSSTEMKAVFDELTLLFQGRSVLMLHHAPKLHPELGPVRVVNTLRGSSYMAGYTDAIWLLNDGYLHIESRFSDPQRLWLQRRKCGFFDRRR